MHPDTPKALLTGEAFYAGYLVRAAGRLPERVFYASDVALGDVPNEGNISVGVFTLIALGVLTGGYVANGNETITSSFTGLTGKDDGRHGDWDVLVCLGTPAAIPHTRDPWENLDSEALRAYLSERVNDYPNLVIIDRASPLQAVRKEIDGDEVGQLGAGAMMGSILLSEHHRATHGTDAPIGFTATTTLWAALSGGDQIVPMTIRFTRTG